ncbi:MAG: hypothetical protein K2I80_06690 [Ruminococcus sp.]|nr:hypothetical protein [Ruminococcus sp.]MDE6848817.1 hypothetical protein [Ruminococcus sp.]
MKLKLTALALILCITAVSCSSKEDSSYTSPESSGQSSIKGIENPDEVVRISDSSTAMENKFKDVPTVESGPLISVNNVTAKAGETAEVTVSVKGADLNWSMCGIHLTYPDELDCVLMEEETNSVEFTKGVASEYNTGFIALECEWQNNPPEELIKKNLGALFFTVMFNGNEGQDGDIATFYFDVPEDAESGTVYPIGFYYMETDMFRNIEGDMSLEKYAFENLQTGSITVE